MNDPYLLKLFAAIDRCREVDEGGGSTWASLGAVYLAYDAYRGDTQAMWHLDNDRAWQLTEALQLPVSSD